MKIETMTFPGQRLQISDLPTLFPNPESIKMPGTINVPQVLPGLFDIPSYNTPQTLPGQTTPLKYNTPEIWPKDQELYEVPMQKIPHEYMTRMN